MFKRQIMRCLATLLAVFSFVPFAMGQTQVLKGKVTESPSGDALPGVSVVEINSNDRQVNGATTDANGNYTLRIADPKNRVRFSYIGSKTQVESINGRSVVNVKLLPNFGELAEVAITAKKVDAPSSGFLNTPKRDLIGSVSSVKGESFEKEPATSIDQMLQGRLAGVQIVSESGDPGGGADVRIRGVATVTGNAQPLYIIDGVPILSSSQGGTEVATTNPIADINPNDIDRIDVLKDANAGAIYGSRANNGVIIITTKRGRPGITNVTLTTRLGLVEGPKSIPVLDASQYRSMQLEGYQNSGVINPYSQDVWPLTNDPGYESYKYYQNNTNWFDGLTQTGINQNYNLSVSGGGEAVKYNFSTSYTNEQGAMVNTGFKRFTGRFNLDYKVSDKLKFAANIAFTRSRRDQYWNLSGGSTPYAIALTRPPVLPVYDIDANGNPQNSYFSLPGNMANGQDNPIAYVNTVSNYSFSTNLQPNISADLQISEALKFKTTASVNFIGENGASFLPPEATGVIWNDGNFNKVQNRDNERRMINVDAFLIHNKQFTKKLRTTFLLGSTYNTNDGTNLTTEGYATATGQMRSLGAAAGYSNFSSIIGDDIMLRVFGQGQFFYDDKYSVNFVLSRDGSSKFGPSNRYGFFPSVGGYWRVSGEPFLKDSRAITDLKLRFSWGETGGNSIRNYAYVSQFATGNNYGEQVGVSQRNPQLNNLRWETSLQKNLGLDLELLRKFTVTVDLYEKTTKDLLFELTLPASSGLPNNSNNNSIIKMLTNLGDIRNRGIEFDVATDLVKAKKATDFNWNALFNIARNVNKVTSLPGGTLVLPNNYAGFQSQVIEGNALGTYYGYVFKGVYATNADAAVRDANGNIVYEVDGITPRIMRLNSETGLTLKGGDAIYEDFNHDGVLNAQDRVLIGNANPDFSGGFTNNFSYKNFSLNVFVNFQYGNDVINGLRYELESMTDSKNQASTVLKRWRTQGDVTDMPRALRGDNRNYIGSTRWIEDGSYARLKTLTIGYKFPTNAIKRYKLRGLDFFLTGTNLFTITGYTGADPEISLGGDLAFGGVDRATNPRTKQYTFGANIKF